MKTSHALDILEGADRAQMIIVRHLARANEADGDPSPGGVPSAANTERGTIIGTATAEAVVFRKARLEEIDFISEVWPELPRLPRLPPINRPYLGHTGLLMVAAEKRALSDFKDRSYAALRSRTFTCF